MDKIKPNEQTVTELQKIIKLFLQRALEAELEEALGYDKYAVSEKSTPNSRNGYSKKNVKTEFGSILIQIPRDRKCEFHPAIIPKHNRSLSGVENKLLALCSRNSIKDFTGIMKDQYGDAFLLRRMSERIMPDICLWKTRTLSRVYRNVEIEPLYGKNGRSIMFYAVLGVTLEGEYEIISLWHRESETPEFWLKVLNDIRDRGTNEVISFKMEIQSNAFSAMCSAVYPDSKMKVEEISS